MIFSVWDGAVTRNCGLDIPEVWGRAGYQRYPVWYTTLEELGVDLGTLPAMRSLPQSGGARGLAEAPMLPLRPAWQGLMSERSRPNRDTWDRFNAILAQFDRIPDLPNATDPLEWDEHGLPK